MGNPGVARRCAGYSHASGSEMGSVLSLDFLSGP